jgi:hypothetical protein
LTIHESQVTFSALRKRGHSLMVKFQPSKLAMRVRFPLPAHFFFIDKSRFF